MFTDNISHRLSNGVEARVDGLYLNPCMMDIVEAWFDIIVFIHEKPDVYCWPWKDVAKYLRRQMGRGGVALHTISGNWTLIAPDEATCFSNAVIMLDRIASVLIDDKREFEILHWCVHELGGKNE